MISVLSINLPIPLIAFGAVLAGSLGIPIPALPILVLAGSAAAAALGAGPWLLLGALAAGVAGGLLGDTVWYLMGRRFGFRVLKLLCRISLSRDSCVRQTGSVLSRFGVRLVLFARFVPGLSVVAVPMTGAAGVSYARFLAHDAIGVLLWAGFGLVLGFAFADTIGALLGMLESFGLGLLGVVIVAIAIYVGVRAMRRRNQRRQLALPRATVAELQQLIDSGQPYHLVDVRSVDQRQLDPEMIPGSRAVAMDAPNGELAAVPPGVPVFVYCGCPNEISAAKMAARFLELGYADVRPLLGGIDAWRQAGYAVHTVPVESAADGPGAVSTAEGARRPARAAS